MIYEVRTYPLKPRTVPEFIDPFGKAYENGRRQFSELGAFFCTEVGPLNEVVHIWPYKSFEHRLDVRAEGVAKGVWPPRDLPKRSNYHSRQQAADGRAVLAVELGKDHE